MKAYPELADALSRMLDRMEASLQAGGHIGAPIRMYLAGGVAVNYWCGTRYTEDVDASFSRRVILPKDLTVNYRRSDGSEAFIYFDHNYNTSFALLHERFEEDAVLWTGLPGNRRAIELAVLAPVDLAVSKIARFSEQDQDDILALARERLINATGLKTRAQEAMGNYIGDLGTVRLSTDLICRRIEDAAQN